jgi:hypothetical protein
MRGTNPVGARFSGPNQTSHVVHPASYAMATGSLFRVIATEAYYGTERERVGKIVDRSRNRRRSGR